MTERKVIIGWEDWARSVDTVLRAHAPTNVCVRDTGTTISKTTEGVKVWQKKKKKKHEIEKKSNTQGKTATEIQNADCNRTDWLGFAGIIYMPVDHIYLLEYSSSTRVRTRPWTCTVEYKSLIW